MLEEYVYHGASKENITSIIAEKGFRINEDIKNKLYLGSGIYFFEKSIHAVTWNIHLFKKENSSRIPTFAEVASKYSIIKARLQVDEENILDLDDLESNKFFDLLILKIEATYGINVKGDYIKAINIMSKYGMIDDFYLIKKIFTFPIRSKMWGKLKNISRMVICVRNKNIIDNIEEFEISKREFDSAVYYA